MKLLESEDFLRSMESELAEKVKDPYISKKEYKYIAGLHIGILYFLNEKLRRELLKLNIDQMTDVKKKP